MYPFIYQNPHIAEICYPTKFLWIETEEPEEPLTLEEEMVHYYDEQWEYYKELWNLVRDNGGEIPISVYVEFLLNELQDGPYWEEMREQFGIFRVPEPVLEPEPEPEPESDTDDDDIEWIYLNDVIEKPKQGA